MFVKYNIFTKQKLSHLNLKKASRKQWNIKLNGANRASRVGHVVFKTPSSYFRSHPKSTSLLRSLILDPLPLVTLCHFLPWCHSPKWQTLISKINKEIIFSIRWFVPIFYLIFCQNRCNKTNCSKTNCINTCIFQSFKKLSVF